MGKAFEKNKACFEQNFEQARALNSQMNKIPQIAITLTGGLWFAAGLTENVDLNISIKFALLLFAGLCNIAFVLISVRLRDVLESYLEKIKKFSGANYASGKPDKPKIEWLSNYSMIFTYCWLMGFASLFSFTGAFIFFWPFNICKWVGVAALIITLFVLWFAGSRPKKK